MRQYLDLLSEVLNKGHYRPSRTGVATFSTFGHTLMFDLQDRFPIVTTKTVPFGQVKGELIGFLRGYTSAAEFRDVGCNVWNANANAPGLDGSPNRWLTNPNRKGEDDLGRIYGAQWRDFRYVKDGRPHTTDQIGLLVDGLKNDPFGRRHVVSAWNPGELDQMALPPCHMFFQCYVGEEENRKGERYLDMLMYQRSVDMFLGLPFNIASYALLLHMLANVTGMLPGQLKMSLGDCHIYENHLSQVTRQLRRTPREEGSPVFHSVPPRLMIGEADPDRDLEKHPISLRHPLQFEEKRFDSIDSIGPENIMLTGYVPHPAIPAPMAV